MFNNKYEILWEDRLKMISRGVYYNAFRPGLHDIGLLFMPDRFPESGTKNAQDLEC